PASDPGGSRTVWLHTEAKLSKLWFERCHNLRQRLSSPRTRTFRLGVDTAMAAAAGRGGGAPERHSRPRELPRADFRLSSSPLLLQRMLDARESGEVPPHA